jgi:hypothetical protein
VFEALGYSKNKDIMIKLSRVADVKYFKSIPDLNREKIESILFHISGLFPEVTNIADEETSEYMRNSLDNWNLAKEKYDSGLLNKNDWNFFKQRPQNFPTIRLAAGARLLEKMIIHEQFIRIINLFHEISEHNKLVTKLRNEIIVQGDGYWASYFNFNKETKTRLNYFIGLGRADEIIINIILPIYSVYFEIHNKKNYHKSFRIIFKIIIKKKVIILLIK